MDKSSGGQKADESVSVESGGRDTGVNCVPGDCICSMDDTRSAGAGAYERAGSIRASRVGRVFVDTESAAGSCSPHQIISVHPADSSAADSLPAPGSIVTCRVLNVTARACRCDILCVGSVTLRHALRGLLRREDVRSTQRDSVKLHESFRPGDLLLARVIAMADATSFLLSTAESELGVAVARSEEAAGAWMIPVSWTEMVCPVTQSRQLRKVAKIPPEDVVRRINAMTVNNSC